MNDLYKRAAEVFGRENQIIVAIEEMAEATKELTKTLRSGGEVEWLAEELADARIMIEQMEQLFGIESVVEKWRKMKLERLAERVEAQEYHGTI